MKDNHGKVGNVLYLKFTSEKMKNRFPDLDFHHGQYLTIDEVNALPGTSSSVPFQIDDDTRGDYEAVCEFGTEIHHFGE